MTCAPSTPMIRHWPGGPHAVHGIYDRAKACTHPLAKRRRTAQLALERQLLALGQPFRHDPSATQAKLCRRIERHLKELFVFELFVFVAEPDVPADNNAAERSLRHLVISRKISGGTRSEQGTTEQDDLGLSLRHLARPRSKSSRRLPSTAHCPSTLNCYEHGRARLALLDGVDGGRYD